MSFSYANPASGPSAGGIGWFNFGNLLLNPGDSLTGLTGTLHDGTTVTFDITVALVSGVARTITAVAVPTWSGTFFGSSNYTGLSGNVALDTNIVYAQGSNTITLSNIVVKDANGDSITNYTTLVADAESTGIGEHWTWETNGGAWKLFATLGNSSSPLLSGIGTHSASMTGNAPANQNDYVLSTQSPTQLILNTSTTNASGGAQAIAIGFAITKVTVQKQVGERINSADQFVLNIAGTPNTQTTTTGFADGIQKELAFVYAIPGNTYTINEAMAPTSLSTLSQYTIITSAVNTSPAGSILPTGTLPITFTPALGDEVTYTILNAAPETFVKTVDKINADIGDVLTYTLSVKNPNSFTIHNILVHDATPVGTTYLGNLMVSAPYVGSNLASGLTITSIGPDDAITISWQVKINTIPPVPSPITNLANIIIPDGTSGSTNVVQTSVNHAYVSTTKTVDKTNANVGSILTYTLVLTNFGNVAANTVVLKDPIPAGTTYVTSSLKGNVAFSGTLANALILTAPIPSGGSATFTYQVQVGNTIPLINPIANTATITYAYTVDPAKQNGASVVAYSNTTKTQVSNATLTAMKLSNKVIAYIGDVITYQIAITNTGNVPADQVVLLDPVVNGTQYVPNSLTASVGFTGSPLTTIHLLHPIAPGTTISLSYQMQVTAIPNPNPIANTMKVAYAYTLNPLDPDGVTNSLVSNTVNTVVFTNNYTQEISDLIQSIALEEAAIGNLANAEGAKIQKMLSMPGVTPEQLLCVNKSVADMLDALVTLESILKQKLNAVDCQIHPTCQ